MYWPCHVFMMNSYQQDCWGQRAVSSQAVDTGNKFPPERQGCISLRPFRIVGCWEVRAPVLTSLSTHLLILLQEGPGAGAPSPCAHLLCDPGILPPSQ